MDDCDEWPGLRGANGYGRIGDKLAHRVAWAEAHGPIPPGMHVLHRCDNPPCVNLEHLFLGTHADNMADMAAKGRAKGGSVRGSQVAQAKLTEAQAAEIKAGLRAGQTQLALATRFGVSIRAVQFIAYGLTWKHVA